MLTFNFQFEDAGWQKFHFPLLASVALSTEIEAGVNLGVDHRSVL